MYDLLQNFSECMHLLFIGIVELIKLGVVYFLIIDIARLCRSKLLKSIIEFFV